jgi:hypothetical protein
VVIPSAGVQTLGSEEGDNFYGGSLPPEREFDSEDDSFALVRSSRSPSEDLESVSGAMVRSPSPGGLNVIWSWAVTERRKEMSQTFFWIAHELCQDLTNERCQRATFMLSRSKTLKGEIT